MTGKALADEHWAWLSSLLEKVYKDAFEHGYKHGREEKIRASSGRKRSKRYVEKRKEIKTR